MEVDNTYLVSARSKVATVEGADQSGVTIAVPERSAPDLFLSRNVKAAKVMRVPGGADAAIETLKSGKAIATPKGKSAASEYVKSFVQDAKRDGTVAEAIRAAGLRRTRVAPPSHEK